MRIEERLSLAVEDVESEMRNGVSFDNATQAVAAASGLHLEGLLAEMKRRFGARPDISLAFVIEEAKQEAILAYLWKIHQAAFLHNTRAPQSPEFRNEIRKQAGIGESANLDSISHMKDRTKSLEKIKYGYDYWLGRSKRLDDSIPERPLFFSKIDDVKKLIEELSRENR